MLNLDTPDIIKKYDKHGMLALLESFSGQCADAKSIGYSFKLPDSYRRTYRNIICTGLGGSAIGADIVRSYLADSVSAPIFVNRSYTLPAFVNSESLVVVVSYSGNTEETISAYEDAKSKKAFIAVITSGGRLLELAGRDGYPSIVIPPGFPPRCALSYSSISLLALLSRTGAASDDPRAIDAVINVTRRLYDEKIGPGVPEGKNIAKAAAKAIYRKFPVIYGAQDHIDAVVMRWKGELAENSKTLSSGNVFPEASHNEIVGWENPAGLLKKFAVIMLRDEGDNGRVSKRLDITKNILRGEGVKTTEIKSEGEGLLARIFSLAYTGDLVSFYLAILNRTDPTKVERITYLKRELAT